MIDKIQEIEAKETVVSGDRHPHEKRNEQAVLGNKRRIK